MRLQFWYSEDIKEWHWSFHTRHYAPNYQSSGSGTNVREVMDKVATEIEHLVEQKKNETS